MNCQRLTYTILIALRTNALWCVETWQAEATRGTIGAKDEALRYYRILNYIEYRMGKFEGQIS